MSDGVFPDRLTQLRNRWESDPSSRVFLQLAEEYRHQGRVKEALDVLERGLKEHPGYLSALVAKGRCLLELGEPDPAREVLERVVKQDATQMVANKLLVRAYLETGDPDRARERLDIYSLLNDSDPEIEELRRRLRTMEQPPQAAKASDDIFDLGQPAPAPPAAAPAIQDDPFAEIFATPVPAAAAPRPPAPALEPEAPEAPEPEDVLFPGLASRDSRQRYLSALAAEGLFSFEPEPVVAAPEPVAESAPPPPAPAPPIPAIPPMSPFPELETPLPTEQVFSGWTPPAEPVPAVFAVEAAAPVEVEEAPAWAPEAPTLVWQREEPAPAAVEEPPVFEIEERTPWAAEPAPLVPEAEAPEAAEAVVPQPVATVTLGELYLRQGHLGEARRIFEEILLREPDSAAAREGLARVAERRREKRPLEVRDLMAGYEPGHEGGEAEVRSRKAYLLSSYLKRLRGGSHSDVS
ncbi:MAG TPA: tetratricopeptide repeat protein [Thermoanaerobaculia bacterium]